MKNEPGDSSVTGSIHCPRILVLADDLTGANDAGVQFTLAGIRSVVVADHRIDRLPMGFPAIVINTESRHLSSFEASARVARAAKLGLDAGITCFYKKTDSTLRGNIAAELESLLIATQGRFIPFVPALPELGRITRDGVHYVHGVPIGETDFARDPLNPVRHNRVAELLATGCKTGICQLRPDETPAADFYGIGVIDCTCHEDLALIASAHSGRNESIQLFSGSVALARFLASELKIESLKPETPAPYPPILLVNGSLNDRSLEQVQQVGPQFSRIQLKPEQLLGDPVAPTVLPEVPKAGHVLLYSVSQRREIEQFRRYAGTQSLSDMDLHLRVAQRLGEWVNQFLSSGDFRTVVVFGGDTLAGIARANDWKSFVPLGEIEPGISVARPKGTMLTLVTKAGGFGAPDVVERITRWVEGAWQART